jgi:hypothetical protein
MDDGIGDKLFVVLFHHKDECIVAKATSKVDAYLYDGRTEWVVWFQPNEVSYFSKLTAIQPDNVFAMPYADIVKSNAMGDFQVLGPLPGKFKGEIAEAIKASDLIPPKLKKNLLQNMG